MLKSDKWITHRCTKPTHLVYDRIGMPLGTLTPPYSDDEKALINNWCNENGRDIYGNKSYAAPLKEEDLPEWLPMIDGFVDQPVRYVRKVDGEPYYLEEGEEPTDLLRRVISYGTSSYGYDVRLADNIDQIKVFTNVVEPEIDPKRMKPSNFGTPRVEVDDDGARYVMIPPHSYLQGPTVEYFRIPRDVLVIVLGKSTYARSALICNVTPIEPEFEGKLTLQITNLTNKHLRVYLDEGVAKLVFSTTDL